MTLALAACAGGPAVVPQVVVPPPSAPRAEFFIDKVQVQSRETGADAWQRNDSYARALADALKQALLARDKALAPPPADTIRPKLYVAYAPVRSTAKGGRRADARVEVRLELIDAGGAVRYATHTETPLEAERDWDAAADEQVRAVLRIAVEDFVSRL